MAKSRIKAGGATRGRFKRKKLGKGWLTHRQSPNAERPVLRITDPVRKATGGAADSGAADAES